MLRRSRHAGRHRARPDRFGGCVEPINVGDGVIPSGAPIREMENSGYMGADTSSGRVARILCGRDVRSRTEAAALTHRSGLV